MLSDVTLAGSSPRPFIVQTSKADRRYLTVRTGEFVGYFHWKPAVMAETGGEFLLMHVSPILHFPSFAAR